MCIKMASCAIKSLQVTEIRLNSDSEGPHRIFFLLNISLGEAQGVDSKARMTLKFYENLSFSKKGLK